jgi:hypothetical protein
VPAEDSFFLEPSENLVVGGGARWHAFYGNA